MAHQWFRLNLSASVFPFATEFWGRSIMVPDLDENYEKVIVSTSDLAAVKGVPQVYFIENVMPTLYGYQSIAWDTYVDPITVPAPVTDFDQAFPFQNADLSKYIYVPASGANYVYDLNNNGWVSASPFLPGTISSVTDITVATVQAQSYIGIKGQGLFVYDSPSMSLIMQNLLGVSLNGGGVSTINGYCSSNGYMLLWNESELLWSSNTNPLDFTPSLITGAGGGELTQAKGKIISVLPISGGFICYCEKNAIAGRYTGNIAYPFALQEIPGTGGITSPADVSWQDDLDTHYCWGSAGLQAITLNSSANIFPDVSEFLTAKIYETYNSVDKTFTRTKLTEVLNVIVTVIEEGYLVISYGLAENAGFTDAFVYDMTLTRWGKVVIDHTDVFQWNSPGSLHFLTYGQLAPRSYDNLNQYTYDDLAAGIPPADRSYRKTIAFLQDDGTVLSMNLDTDNIESNGVILLGKYQARRNKWINFQRADIEGVESDANFTFSLLPSYDGKTLSPYVSPGIILTSDLMRRYGYNITAQNISLLLEGAFDLTTVLMDFTVAGDR